jgi:diphthamide biosynthesis methyltransferase
MPKRHTLVQMDISSVKNYLSTNQSFRVIILTFQRQIN